MDLASCGLAICMAMLMLYTGLICDLSSFRDKSRRTNWREFGILAFVNYAVIPLTTLSAVWAFSLPPILNLTLLTLAMLPCAPLVPALVAATGESPDWSIFTFLGLSILNIGLISILVPTLSLPWVAGDYVSLKSGTGTDLVKYLLSIYGPMSIGIAVRYFAPRQLPFWITFFRRVVHLSGPPTIIVFMFMHRTELFSLGWLEIGAMIAFEIACLLIAMAFFRIGAKNRLSNILACTLRNFAMGISFTAIVFPQTAASSHMVAFIVLLLWGTALWVAIKRKLSINKTKGI